MYVLDFSHSEPGRRCTEERVVARVEALHLLQDHLTRRRRHSSSVYSSGSTLTHSYLFSMRTPHSSSPELAPPLSPKGRLLFQGRTRHDLTHFTPLPRILSVTNFDYNKRGINLSSQIVSIHGKVRRYCATCGKHRSYVTSLCV